MYRVYQVQLGDTINSIAQKLGVDPELIIAINGITDSSVLQAGNQIIVPVRSDLLFQNYVVEKGNNIYEIAQKYNVDYRALLALNGLSENDYIYPEQTIMVPMPGVNIYSTKEGDTIASVANYFQAPIDQFLAQNDIIYLMPNQLLVYRK